MKFTSEDLMKAMCLQVGDRIKFNDVDWDNHIYKIVVEDGLYLIKTDLEQSSPLYNLLNRKFEILPRLKRVGDLKCDDFECSKCPLRYICSFNNQSFATNNNLFDILELFKCDDQEIYDLLKARLDKEVE